MGLQIPRSAKIHPGPGFRIKLGCERIDPEIMEQFRGFQTPDISDQLNRMYALSPSIKCMTSTDHALCGPACTVRVFPGDNLMVHKALDVARPGDVVVINAGGAMSNAVLGDIICTKAKHLKIAGFVIDGLIRDLPSILPLDIPVYACGTTSIGPLHRGPGEVNYPIACGGIVVFPGDLVVADSAGIVIVRKQIAPELLRRLQTFSAAQNKYLEAVRRGEFSNKWVDDMLATQGCIIEE